MIKNPIDLQSCVESMQANVFVADRDFNLVYINPHAKKMLEKIDPIIQEEFCLSAEDFLGGPIHRFHRDSRKVESILKNPSALPCKVDLEFGNMILRSRINAISDETGQIDGYVVSWEDVTERNKIEKALSAKLEELDNANQELLKRNKQIEKDQANLKRAHAYQRKMDAYMNLKLAELKQSNQDLESFATIASHDLKAPVRKIINFTDLLLENNTHFLENEMFLLNKINNSGKRMNILMDDLLEYSRLAGHSFAFVKVNLNDVLSEVLSNLSFEIAETKGEVHFDSLPVIEANYAQMVHLIQNLISNSLKYRKENVPPVVRVSSAFKDGEFIKIIVEDNGIGIDDKFSSLVFQPFERLHPEIEGAGMGLAICKKVVVGHGGDISLKSLPDRRGLAVSIIIPERHAK